MNKANIDKLIAWLKADAGEHFEMGEWRRWKRAGLEQKQEYCDTTFCLAGHCDVLVQTEAGSNLDQLVFNGMRDGAFGYFRTGAQYLGLLESQAKQLFMMAKSEDGEDDEDDGLSKRCAFDRLPDCHRIHAAIRVLQHLRDTGEVDWDGAIQGEVGGESAIMGETS